MSKKNISFVCTILIVLFFSVSTCYAEGGFGENVNAACAPETPFTGSCSYCHTGSYSANTAAKTAYLAGGTTLTDFFCPSGPICTDNDGDTFAVEGGACGPVDCDDTNATVNPGAVEICGDGLDNTCDGVVDEGCVVAPVCTDSDGDTYAIEGGECGPVDCNDLDSTINPGAAEICTDGIDNDCDNLIDTLDLNALGCPANDFNGDAKSDILFRNSDNGQIWMYQMDGNTILDSSAVSGVSLDWNIDGTDDFNGDNKADILFRNTVNGAIWLYQMDGNTIISSSSVGGVSLNWNIVSTDDFNGDNKADILFRNTVNGAIWLYQMDGNTIISSSSVGGVSLNWNIVGTGDFNGDNKADILLRNTVNGAIWLYQMDGNAIIGSNSVGGVGLNWNIVGTDDFNGDNTADILLRNTVNGAIWLYQMDGNAIIGSGSVGGVGLNWNIVGTEDFNGDNTADILFLNSANGAVWLFQMDGNTIIGSGSVGGVAMNWNIM